MSSTLAPLQRVCQNEECGKPFESVLERRFCSAKCSTRKAWKDGIYADRPKRPSKKVTHRQIWVPKDKVIFVILAHPLRAGDAEMVLKHALKDDALFHDKFEMASYDALTLNSLVA